MSGDGSAAASRQVSAVSKTVATRLFQITASVIGPVIPCNYCGNYGAALRASRSGWRWHCRRCSHSWRSAVPRW